MVRCIITREALEKLAHNELVAEQYQPTFHEHRDRIEATASRKYDTLPVLYQPLTITPADLALYRQSPVV